MYKNYLKNSAKLFAVIALPVALALTGCVEDKLQSDVNVPDDVTPSIPSEEVTPLSRASLASFNSNQGRVVVEPQSRAALPGELKLFASIDNLSKEEGKINGFVQEENGRFLSATCVYYDKANDTYYVTYHMQGNNYNTKQEDQTSGYIETFKLNPDGTPVVGKVFMAEKPGECDFDFNHLLFDNTGTDTYYRGNDKIDRLIAVGHKSEPTKSGKTQTAAIIGKLDLTSSNPSIEYKTVYTGEKILDAEGKSLGKVDAQDVNSVIRVYDWYYLATRKGLAVLNAQPENLFDPIKDGVDYPYFIKTPGSAKFVYDNPGQYSHFSCLYLTEDTPEGFDYDTASGAKIANFFVHGYAGYIGQTSGDISDIEDVQNYNILSYADQLDVPAAVSPVDGKNVLFMPEYSEYYACLGKGGLYVKNAGWWTSGVKTFGDTESGSGRPVNGVYVDGAGDDTGGEYHNGYVYVANGRCLTILDRATLEVVAEYSAPIDEEASANFIHVYNTVKNQDERRTERIIVVAYGQAGVKVFKFIPPTKW